MMKLVFRIFFKAARGVSLVLLAAIGATLLMHCAPGYFADTHEMDASHGQQARVRSTELKRSEGSVNHLILSSLRAWSRGDLGRSRQFDLPVSQLIQERASASGKLLLRATCTGWLLASLAAVSVSARRRLHGELLLTVATAALLALPVGVLATLSLVANKGGPVTVLALLIAVRDFKLLYRLLCDTRTSPALLFARAQGTTFVRCVTVHLWAFIKREVGALGMLSVVVALSALVPVEVIFDVPGLGQMAWTAAMNRDLPVLIAVTALLAGLVSGAGILSHTEAPLKASQCVS